MKIEDGGGSGRFVKVNSDQQLEVFSIIEAGDKFQNRTGKSWSVSQSTTPVGANDYVFYFKNTGNEIYTVTDIRASCAGASTLTINHVSGTPSYTAGVALTPVNRNLTRSDTMTATIYEDTNTTGLTSLGELFFIECPTASTLEHLRTSSNIIIPPGQAIAMATDGTTAVHTLWSFTVLTDL